MKLKLGAELPAAGEEFLPSAEAIVRSVSRSPFGRNFGSTIDLHEGPGRAGELGARADPGWCMPCLELGRYRRYDRDAVLGWLESCRARQWRKHDPKQREGA
jgi:hypothetical protein